MISHKHIRNLDSLIADKDVNSFKEMFIKLYNTDSSVENYILPFCSHAYNYMVFDVIVFLADYYYDRRYLLSEYCKYSFMDCHFDFFYKLFPLYPLSIDGLDFKNFLDSIEVNEDDKLKMCRYLLMFTGQSNTLYALARVFIKRHFRKNYFNQEEAILALP